MSRSVSENANVPAELYVCRARAIPFAPQTMFVHVPSPKSTVAEMPAARSAAASETRNVKVLSRRATIPDNSHTPSSSRGRVAVGAALETQMMCEAED